MCTALVIVGTVTCALYLYLSLTCFFTQVTFMAAYKLEYRSSGSHPAALRAAMKTFRDREPFRALTEKDLDRALDVLCLIPDPREVAKIVRDIDRKQDASLLANQEFLGRLEAEYHRLNSGT